MTFINKLRETEPELAAELRKIARHVIFNYMPLVAPWYRAIYRTTLFSMIGVDDMIDEVAAEIYLGEQSGMSQEDALRQASALCLKAWRKMWDKKTVEEWSIQEAEHRFLGGGDRMAQGSSQRKDGDLFAELSVASAEEGYFEEYVDTHSEWGPKHVTFAKVWSMLTEAEREAVVAYADLGTQKAAGELLGLSERGANRRIINARKKVLAAMGAELVDAGLIDPTATRKGRPHRRFTPVPK